MTARLKLDNAGRVVIPKPLRAQLDLAPGDALELEAVGDRITLRPVREAAALSREKGVWVFRTGQPLTATDTDAVLEQIRSGRDERNIR